MPLGFSSILLPCFFCSPHPTPNTTLSSSTSVTAALRPGSQKQLVCLPALLTTANLWLEGTLTSLPTTQPHIHPQTLLSSWISPLQPGCCTVIASMYCNLFSSLLCRNIGYNEKRERKITSRTWLQLLASLLLCLKHRESVRSFLSTLADSHESALHVALLPSSSSRLPERKRSTEDATGMVKKEGRECTTYRKEHRELRE